MISRRAFVQRTGSALAAVGLVRALPAEPAGPTESPFGHLPQGALVLSVLHFEFDGRIGQASAIIRGTADDARNVFLQYGSSLAPWQEPYSIARLNYDRPSPVLAMWSLPSTPRVGFAAIAGRPGVIVSQWFVNGASQAFF